MIDSAATASEPQSAAPRRRMFVLMSHGLTAQQRADASARFGIAEDGVVEMDEAERACWRSIDPNRPDDDPGATNVVNSLLERARAGDLVLVHGEPGAAYHAVTRFWAAGLEPVYAATERKSRDTHLDSGVVLRESVFEHVRFRHYPAPIGPIASIGLRGGNTW